MSAYTRKDSKYWQLYLEPIGKREKTDVLVGETRQEKQDGKIRARALYVSRMKEISDGASGLVVRPPRIFADHARFYLENITPQHKGKVREAWILNRLVLYFGEKLLLTQLDLELVKKWRKDRLSKPTVVEHFGGPKGKRRIFPPPSRRTLHREETVLRQVLAEAVPKYLATSPLAHVAKLTFDETPQRNITDEEMERLVTAIRNPADRVIWWIAFDCLLRLGSVLALEKADDKGDHFEVRTSKTGPLKPTISPRVRALLDALPSTAGPHLFPHRRTQDTMEGNVHAYTHMLTLAATRAGVPWGKKNDGSTFHWGTRRTGATKYLHELQGAAGVKKVAELGGWKDTRVLERIYHEVTMADKKALTDTRTLTPAVAPVEEPAWEWVWSEESNSFEARPAKEQPKETAKKPRLVGRRTRTA